jgi:hypothetical protein
LFQPETFPPGADTLPKFTQKHRLKVPHTSCVYMYLLNTLEELPGKGKQAVVGWTDAGVE